LVRASKHCTQGPS